MMQPLFCKAAATAIAIAAVCFNASAQNTATSNTSKELLKARLQMLTNLAAKSDPEAKKSLEETMAFLLLEKPEVRTLQLKNKTVKFIPVAHAGQQLFYDNIRAIVSAHKKEGYVVFYEQIKSNKPAAGKTPDTTELKFRKMVGVSPSRKTYSLLKIVFPGIVVQPVYDSLGVAKTDINADVTTAQMVRQYEKLYGRVRIDSCDKATPADALLYPCSKLNNDLDPVILDFRNANLSAMIRQSPHDKILVIYGANHIGPVMEMLAKKQ